MKMENFLYTRIEMLQAAKKYREPERATKLVEAIAQKIAMGYLGTWQHEIYCQHFEDTRPNQAGRLMFPWQKSFAEQLPTLLEGVTTFRDAMAAAGAI